MTSWKGRKVIEYIQTGTILLIVIGGWYQRKNFQLMDDRLREIELLELKRLEDK
jgi:hypothetical protein